MQVIRKILLAFTIAQVTLSQAEGQSAWEKLKQATRQLPRATTNSPQKPETTEARREPQASPETGTPELTASLASSAGFLDVTGIKLGMKVKDAMVALKEHNGLLKVTPDTYVHQLIPNQTLVSGADAVIPLVQGQIFERYHLAFTTQPNDSFVMAVTRTVHYPPGQQPSFTSAIDGMRAKYGKENFVPRASASGPSFFWIMDLQGKPVTGPDLQRIVETCTSPFLVESWVRAADTVTRGYDERTLSNSYVRCSSYATVGVYFQGSLIPGQTTYLLDNLTVVASNGALYRSATEATHAQYLAVQKKLDTDRMNDAQRKGVQF